MMLLTLPAEPPCGIISRPTMPSGLFAAVFDAVAVS